MRPDTDEIHQTQYTQPALFAFEYALAQTWRSWGIEPHAVLGHSVGEYVAACIAGVFTLEDGLRLIAERARLMGALPQNGTMAAVFADATRIAQAIQPFHDKVSIAATNGPDNTVISGEASAVQTILG
jgi:acyl transferase domain-containing protein